jgi:pseudouridine synthase
MAEGRVAVNGAVVTLLGSRADPERDDIRVDGRRIAQPARPLYLLLNKPRGYVTTRVDPEGRPTVLDLVAGVRAYLFPVGRLDYDSEGLLLLTNDGDLAARLTHPRHGVRRVYEVTVRGVPDPGDIERLAGGVQLEGRRTQPAEVTLLKRLHGGGRLRISLAEGRNRQVRRMCAAIGHPVTSLRRVAIGPLRDPALEPGQWRPLTPAELSQIRRAAGCQAAATRPAGAGGGPRPRVRRPVPRGG